MTRELTKGSRTSEPIPESSEAGAIGRFKLKHEVPRGSENLNARHTRESYGRQVGIISLKASYA